MNQLEEIKLLESAIIKFGRNNQMDMLMEECAELIQAVNKLKRDPTAKSIRNICSEIADVEIMIRQVRIMISKDDLIDNIKQEKLLRLRTSLANAD